MNSKISDLDFILRILLALFIGAIIGLERQFKNRHAGIRTFAIICLTSSFITMIGKFATPQFEVTYLPQNIMAVIISVGFIGAGIIFKDKGEKGMIIVRGLTTVATLLITSTIGFAIGLGLIKYALIVGVVTIISLFSFRKIELKTGLKKELYEVEKHKK